MFRIDRSLVQVSGHKIKDFSADLENKDAENEQGYSQDSEYLLDESAFGLDLGPSELAMEMFDEYVEKAEQEMQGKAKSLINDAKVEAAQILLNAREEVDEERKRGWQEGYSEGVEEGKRSYDDKVQSCEEALAEKVKADDEALKNVFDELYREQERIISESEEETVNLALEIVKKIIRPAEEELGTVFTSLVKNTLQQMSTDGKIVIRVGPTEYERFFSSGAAVIELDSGIKVSATVMKELTMNEGDLIIDSDEGTVNASIDSQLEYVKIAFERANQYEPD